jgi:hypothetical protein
MQNEGAITFISETKIEEKIQGIGKKKPKFANKV